MRRGNGDIATPRQGVAADTRKDVGGSAKPRLNEALGVGRDAGTMYFAGRVGHSRTMKVGGLGKETQIKRPEGTIR